MNESLKSSKTASYADLLVMVAQRDAEIERMRVALNLIGAPSPPNRLLTALEAHTVAHAALSGDSPPLIATNLKSCPFCRNDGKNPAYALSPKKLEPAFMYIHCERCGAQGPCSSDAIGAAIGWNKHSAVEIQPAASKQRLSDEQLRYLAAYGSNFEVSMAEELINWRVHNADRTDWKSRAEAAEGILNHNMALANATTRKVMEERNAIIRKLRERHSAIEIAEQVGLTRQRVYQILNEAPMPQDETLAPLTFSYATCNSGGGEKPTVTLGFETLSEAQSMHGWLIHSQRSAVEPTPLRAGHIYSPREGTEVCFICGFHKSEHAPEHMPTEKASGTQT